MHSVSRQQASLHGLYRDVRDVSELTAVSVIQTLDNANQLAGQSGLVNYLQQLQSQYSIVSKCSTTQSS